MSNPSPRQPIALWSQIRDHGHRAAGWLRRFWRRYVRSVDSASSDFYSSPRHRRQPAFGRSRTPPKPQMAPPSPYSGLTVALATVAVLLLAVGFFYLHSVFFGPPENRAQPERFVVEEGDSRGGIVNSLYEEGFVAYRFAGQTALFWEWLAGGFGLWGPSGVDPGAYRISREMSAWELANYLMSEEPDLKWVTLPAGARKEQIAIILSRDLGWSNQERREWVEKHTAKRQEYTEGIFLPDTYLIPVDESPRAVAERFVDHFNEQFQPYQEQFTEQNIRWTTGLTIASLIQREAAGADDMPLIAGVIWNRLENEMRLEIDASTQYAKATRAYEKLREEGEAEAPLKAVEWWAPIKLADRGGLDSPFNTYTNDGVPPHPIASPSIAAIEAVLEPAETDCFYYIHTPTREIHCSESFEGHKRNVDIYLR